MNGEFARPFRVGMIRGDRDPSESDGVAVGSQSAVGNSLGGKLPRMVFILPWEFRCSSAGVCRFEGGLERTLRHYWFAVCKHYFQRIS